MPRIYQNCILAAVFLLFSLSTFAQQTDSTMVFVDSTGGVTADSVFALQDTVPVVPVNPIEQIYKSRFAKTYTVKGIEVSGNTDFDRNLIVSISGLAIGDKIQLPGSDAFAKAIDKLWSQDLVSDVKIYITQVIDQDIFLEINITQRPRLLDFNIEGVKQSERDDLLPKLGLNKDRVVSEEQTIRAVENIQKHYRDKGYRNVTVTLKEEPYIGINNALRYTFYVNKGNKVRVNSINFAGNPSIPDLRLKKSMKDTKEMSKITLFPSKIYDPYNDTTHNPGFRQYMREVGYLRPTVTKEYLDPYVRIKLFGNSKYNPVKYKDDQAKVVTFYNSRGYRDAQIVADTVISDGQGNVNLHMKINEGHQYYFGNITWKGNTKYSDSVLNRMLNINKGDIYNVDILNKRLGKEMSPEGGDISSLYQDNGYLFFNITPIETAVYNDTIDHEIRIVEGPQATYGSITVTGNEKTKDYVILREVRTVPGEQYSRSDIIRTIRELGQLGYLNAEKIQPNIVPNADNGTVDINWQVEEKSADQLELSAGFGGGIGLTGTLGVSFNNFSIKNILRKESWSSLPTGDGQKLSLRLQANGRQYRSYNFSFTEPWLGGKKRNPFTISYFNTRFGRTYDGYGYYCRSCGDTSYIKNGGFTISLGKQLKWPDDYFSLVYALNVQTFKLRNYGGFFRDPETKEDIKTGHSTNISFRIGLQRSSAGPNPIFPTSGSNFMLSSQFTLPYSMLGITDKSNQFELPEFHKWRFNAEWFVPIGNAKGEDRNKQFVFRAAAKYGFLGKYNSKLQLAPFERFQLGDAGMSNNFALLGYDIIAHRGYPIYTSSDPKVNPENVANDQYFPIFNKYTMELRYPFSTNASSTIYGLAFFEAANGWYSFKEYNPFRLRRSAGLGMRFFLPMFGLLGFDYGVGFDRYNQTNGLKGAAKFTFMLGQEPE